MWHLLLIVGRRIGRMVGLPPMLAGPSAGRNRAMRENQSRLRERKSVQCPVNELGEVGAVCLHAPMPFWVPTQVAFPPMRWNVPILSHIVPSSGGIALGSGAVCLHPFVESLLPTHPFVFVPHGGQSACIRSLRAFCHRITEGRHSRQGECSEPFGTPA